MQHVVELILVVTTISFIQFIECKHSAETLVSVSPPFNARGLKRVCICLDLRETSGAANGPVHV